LIGAFRFLREIVNQNLGGYTLTKGGPIHYYVLAGNGLLKCLFSWTLVKPVPKVHILLA
jgi:hypothetical protein